MFNSHFLQKLQEMLNSHFIQKKQEMFNSHFLQKQQKMLKSHFLQKQQEKLNSQKQQEMLNSHFLQVQQQQQQHGQTQQSGEENSSSSSAMASLVWREIVFFSLIIKLLLAERFVKDCISLTLDKCWFLLGWLFRSNKVIKHQSLLPPWSLLKDHLLSPTSHPQ